MRTKRGGKYETVCIITFLKERGLQKNGKLTRRTKEQENRKRSSRKLNTKLEKIFIKAENK